MRGFYYTNRGKVRSENEDRILIKGEEVIVSDGVNEPVYFENRASLFLVADGMGGTKEGKEAVDLLIDGFVRYDFCDEEELKAVLENVVKELEKKGIDGGSVFSLVKTDSSKALVANAGDCRVYKKKSDYLIRLSKDHSLVEELIDAGMIDVYEAFRHPKSNIVTSSIMPFRDFKLFFKTTDMKEGDIFLICSDGVWGEIDIDEFDEIFSASDLESINKALFESLMQKELSDNLSYILFEVKK